MEVYSENYIPSCVAGHQLVWHQMSISSCPGCKKSGGLYSRWKCTACNHNYCVFCFKPPTFGSKCPKGHELVKKTNLYGNTCDVCRKNIGGEGWRDSSCDFDVCMKCKAEYIRED